MDHAPAARVRESAAHQGWDGSVARGVALTLLCTAAFVAAWSPALMERVCGPAALLAYVCCGRRPRPRAADLLAAALAVWALTIQAWAPERAVAFRSAYLYAAACLMFIAVRHVVRTRFAWFLVGYAALAGCLVATGKLLTGTEAGNVPSRDSIFDFSVRYGIDGVNFNYTSYTLVTGLVLGLALLLLRPATLAERLGIAAALLLIGYGVVLTGTRASVIGVLLGVCLLLLSRVAPKVARLGAATVTPAALILIPLGLYQLFSSETLWLDGLFGRPTGDLSGRTGIWPVALTSWSESLLTGVGPSMFTALGPLGVGPHNLLLTLGTDLGLIGVLLYGGVFATALAAPLRHANPVCWGITGIFLVALLPVWLTGHWEKSVLCFAVAGLVSVAPQVVRPATPGRRTTPDQPRPVAESFAPSRP
ncbi:O-antigen ligase like membrane protein [Micromonospora narathiwatensis]|uniref:O-antigen ligase like membrane protein n=1 Tax=Micromonospora narathiwatensis TaxID=299146 RepID=A0A1A8Z629_9ACTN|nr:O-antigen ligase like membrane protein [Micromonospora narathiwatensis]